MIKEATINTQDSSFNWG